MIYKFVDEAGTFVVDSPQKYNLYFPLTNSSGTLLSSISPNLAGDIKQDNEHFLNIPVSIEDIRSNLLCRREFFIKANKKIVRLSYPYDDKLEAGLLYHKIIKRIESLHIEILNFIPYDLAVEVMWIKVVNTGKNDIGIIPTSFMPLYGRAEKNLRDHRHVSSLLNRIELDKYGIFLKPTMVFDEKGHTENKSIYFVLGYEDKGSPPIGQFPTLDYFLGKNDLVSPEAIEKDIKPATKKIPEFDGKENCAAFRFNKRRLKAGKEINYFLFMGISSNKQKIKNIFLELNSPQKIEQKLKETKSYWINCLSSLSFDFNNRDFNNWLLWVKLQPTLRKLFGCSFLPHFDYGKGGRGWRDLWQDVLTLLLTEPHKAKDLILHNFKGVRVDGSNATIITKNGEFIADRNKISRVWMDHGIWPYLALRSYIHKSGDLGILLNESTYFKDHQIKRAKGFDANFSSKDHCLRNSAGRIYEGSVLEHVLVQNLTQFFNVGNHNIVRLENADWNDGLDMAAQYGESVALSFMYAHNLRDLCALLERLKNKITTLTVLKELSLLLDRLDNSINYNRFREKQERLEKYLEKTKNISGKKIKINIDDLIYDLKEKSKHLSKWIAEREWLREGFFNGYYDNKSRRVEGKIKNKIQMMLSPQVFAIMSGVATEKQIQKIWFSIKRYLQDKKLEGFHLNTDFGSVYLDLGRAFGFSYGDKENGAFFNHMVVMLAYALYKKGFIKEGFEVINSIYKMATNLKGEIYPVIPEYFNNEGKGLYLYLTGSASWYVYTLLEEILGIKFILGDLAIEPKLIYANFFNHKIKVRFALGDKIVETLYIIKNKKNTPYKIENVFLGTREIFQQGNKFLIKKEDFKTLKKKEVGLRVYLS